ncbi:ATP-binding cassette domain-containing protein [Streptomyces avermitilis]
MNRIAPPPGWELLAALAVTPSAENRRLDGRHTVHLVEAGPADLFASRRTPDGGTSRRHFICRCPAYSALPSPAALGEWQLTLEPLPGCRLRVIDQRRPTGLRGLTRRNGSGEAGPDNAPGYGPGDRIAATLSDALDQALQATTDILRSSSAPGAAEVLHPGEMRSLTPGRSVVGSGRPGWIRPATGRICKNGRAGQLDSDQRTLFLGIHDWAEAESDCLVEFLSTSSLLRSGTLFEAIDLHLSHVLSSCAERARAEDAAFLRALGARRLAAEQLVAASARRAFTVLGAKAAHGGVPAPPGAQDSRAWAVETLRAVTEGTDVVVTEPPTHGPGTASPGEELRAVARSSGLHLRQVRLPEDRWWRDDAGPLIGWRRMDPHEPGPDGKPAVSPVEGREPAGDTGEQAGLYPVPLLFVRGTYRAMDPHTRKRTPLDRRLAATFAHSATLVQPPLPARSSVWRLLRLGGRGCASELRAMSAHAIAVAVLNLATPLLVGRVFAGLLKGGPREPPWSIGLYLAGAVAAALFTVLLNLRSLRLEDRLESGVQLALWDRLIRLPSGVFDKSTSGVLTNKVLGFAYVRQALNGLPARILQAALTAVGGLALTLGINPGIGLCALALLAGAGCLSVALGVMVFRRQRQALPAEHRAVAVTNELFGGIRKIKLVAAESSMFSRWAQSAITARAGLQRVHRMQAAVSAVAATLPVAGQLVFFAALAGPLRETLPASEFFVLNAAFATVLYSTALLVTAGAEFVAVLPRLHGLTELLTTRPERESACVDPGELRGEIELVDATFRYPDQNTPVLDRVSLHARPGEFIAIVGPSGSGKSTLLRLLSGFERPDSGSVLFDGQDLGEIDVQAVRSQCGVILQDDRLFGGTLRENICGARPYSAQQVRAAADMAGLTEDLREMPMGLNTLVSFGGGTLSVGQRQRVLVARALISQPKMLFFDEATSALDNEAQDVVMSSTHRAAATRIVIAHRLSTVIDADLIVVMDAGRVVQSGTYQELLADPGGLFYRLARRQLWAGPTVTHDEATAAPPAERKD